VRTPLLLAAAITVVTAVLPAAPAFAGPVPPHDSGCPAQKVTLAGRTFTSADQLDTRHLKCADLRGAVLDGLDLSQVDFQHVDAEGASFRHADLSQSDFDFADLKGAHFDHATLDQADLQQVHAHGAFFPYASLAQTDLTDSDLSAADLNLAGLDQADLTRTDLRGASLWGTHSIEAHGGNTKVSLIQPGSFQLEWAFVIIALVFLLRALVSAARPRWRGFRAPVSSMYELRKVLAKPFAPLVFTALMVGFIGHIALARLQFPDLWQGYFIPVAITAGLMFLACVIRGPVPRHRSGVPLILRTDLS
jgi:hypothetical protein